MTQRKISVIGLGYVGLPVAVAFGRKAPVVGFDINPIRLKELKSGVDHTGEVTAEELSSARITFTNDTKILADADFHIVAVPTPVNDANQPDLTPLVRASETVGAALKKGDIVVYESTVYPGVTEEECVPVLEKISGLRCGEDFTVGYSPERINPGDKERTFTTIKKIVSGQDATTLETVASVYESVVTAGVYRAESIKVAEAAKIIENTQRDINIALMNELAVLFDRLGIDTINVLNAAGTKWNFLNFRPGLVGGHCIGVDPYYLTYKAERVGYIPQVIHSGRRINNEMGKFVAQRTIKEMIRAGIGVAGSTVTVCGVTFKENCPDIRNSRVVDVVAELEEFGVQVQVWDPQADPALTHEEYGVHVVNKAAALKRAHALIICVAHREFREMRLSDWLAICCETPVVYDVKGILNKEALRAAGVRYSRL